MNIQLKYQLKAHKGAIYSLASSNDSSKVLSAGADRKVIEWDVNSGEGRLIANSAATVVSLFYLKEEDLLFIGQTEGGVHVIDLKEKKEVKYLKAHEAYIFDLLYLPHKKEMIFSCGDGSISVWSIESFEMLYKKSFCSEKIRKMDLSPDASMISLSQGNNSISILSTEDYSEINTIKGDSAFNVSRFMADGSHLLAGDRMAHLHKIRLSDGKILESLAAHYWAIYDIVFSPDEQYFATASRDKIIKIWDIDKMKVIARLEGRKMNAHIHSVNSLLWNEQETLVSAGDDGDLRVWDLKA